MLLDITGCNYCATLLGQQMHTCSCASQQSWHKDLDTSDVIAGECLGNAHHSWRQACSRCSPTSTMADCLQGAVEQASSMLHPGQHLPQVLPAPHSASGAAQISSHNEQQLSALMRKAASLLRVGSGSRDAASLLGAVLARLKELTQEGGDARMAAVLIVSRSDLGDEQVGPRSSIQTICQRNASEEGLNKRGDQD